MYRLLELLGAPLGGWQASSSCDDRACNFLGGVLEPDAADMLLNPSWTSARIGALPAVPALVFKCCTKCGCPEGPVISRRQAKPSRRCLP